MPRTFVSLFGSGGDFVPAAGGGGGSPPDVRSLGTVLKFTTGDCVVPMAAGIQAGDILLCFLRHDHTDPGTLTIDQGFATLFQYAPTPTELTTYVAWKRAVGGDSAPTITGSGQLAGIAQIMGVFGCVGSGSPFNSTPSNANVTSTNTINAASITPADPNSLIIGFWASRNGAAGSQTYSGYSGTNPVFDERTDEFITATWNFCGMALATGVRTTADATGDRTVTSTQTEDEGNGHLMSLKAA